MMVTQPNNVPISGRRCWRRNFAGAAQVHRENARQVVSPEAELRHGEQPGEEDADVKKSQFVTAKKPKTTA